MPHQILIAAPPRIARKLAEAIGDRFEITTCHDPERATALAAVGTYLAVVMPAGFAALSTEAPILHVTDTMERALAEQLSAIAESARSDQRSRADELAHLAALPYDEYIALARARTTRNYLLALLRRHGGVITEAAREAGLLRETLHRLIRRYDVDPGWFREK